jgi:hypothetical protein
VHWRFLNPMRMAVIVAVGGEKPLTLVADQMRRAEKNQSLPLARWPSTAMGRKHREAASPRRAHRGALASAFKAKIEAVDILDKRTILFRFKEPFLLLHRPAAGSTGAACAPCHAAPRRCHRAKKLRLVTL